jgi:hypothetical protein
VPPKEEVVNVNLLNEQLRLVQRGLDECRHSFEILIDAFVHAEQGTIQPQLITAEKIKSVIMNQKLPTGTDYPTLPFSELSKIITPSVYSYKQYVVYVLEIPLLSPREYHLYRVLPFPVKIHKEQTAYSYVNFNKGFLFSDSLRQHYGKMTTNELANCFQPNYMTYVCKEEISIYTYVPEADCEATLLHPSTVKAPDICEYRLFTLSNTLWIPLHMSIEWLFVTPQVETFTVLCAQGTTTLKLQKEGKLSLRDGCKGYSSHVTLYAISTIETNVTNDYVPSATINFDNCFEDLKDTPFENLPLHAPLVNVMSSVDDLRIASINAEEVQQLIKEQEFKHDQNLYNMMTSKWSILGTTSLIFMFILCSCCCCKSCRNCFFWIWDKWNPKGCWDQTKERCSININNYSCPEVSYAKHDRPSPATSLRSLPELESVALSTNRGSTPIEKSECIAIRTRSKTNFR